MHAAVPRESGVLASVLDEIDGFIAAALARRDLPRGLDAAIRYSSLDGGKRLRPALLLLSCEAVGGDRASALPAAAAIELIHDFSLVHDDLPAMDDDDMRRGRPTLHVHAGEAMAILAGDAMISIAFELLTETEVAPADAVRLVGELARATTAMVGGQVYDTLGGLPAGLSDEEQLALIHRSKTGALLRAACRMGAICGSASDQEMKRLDRFGEALGLMFQIVDDLLDVTQSSEHLGKAAGKDVSKGKLTYPGLLGLERSRRDVERLRVEAIDALSAFGRRADPLRALAADMAVRTR